MTYNKLIFELSKPTRIGYTLAEQGLPKKYELVLDKTLLRKVPADLPEVSELDIVRHYTNVSSKNIGIESGFYPLGSCTMKYNPKINEEVASYDCFRSIHPLQDVKSIQPILKIYDDTAKMLSEISGMAEFSLHPFAGAHGELTGLMIMKAYHQRRGDFNRKIVIIPDSAHGTNPASAALLGFDIVTIASNSLGMIDLVALKDVLSPNVAGIMLTNPNTVGLFEIDILEISRLVHEVGGLLYYDGANLNPLLGVARPGDMGFDIMHINLHKTFSTPHGGGGPGSGPVGVAKHLVELLPNPQIKLTTKGYQLFENPESCGHVSGFYGNFLVVVKAYSYLRTMGPQLSNVGPLATLNANYIKEKLKDYYLLPISRTCMHEFVFNGLIDKTTGVSTLDVAKRLLDFGIHAPTIYFPHLFEQSLMVEPTENESIETLDNFIKIMIEIAKEAKEKPDFVKNAPYNTPVGRLDEVTAARKPLLTWNDLKTNV